MPKCPVCEGEGGWSEDMGEGTVLWEPCNYCPDETGRLSLWRWLGYWWFQYSPLWYQEWRIARCNREEHDA